LLYGVDYQKDYNSARKFSSLYYKLLT